MMRYSHPYPVNKLFSDTVKTSYVSLSKIYQHSILLLQINRAVLSLLPEPLRYWCRVVNVRRGVLVLETPTASWKIRLYHEQLQLLSTLKLQILPSLLYIDIRINSSLVRKQVSHRQNNYGNGGLLNDLSREKTRYLSIQSAASICHVAAISNGKLKSTLERLASMAK